MTVSGCNSDTRTASLTLEEPGTIDITASPATIYAGTNPAVVSLNVSASPEKLPWSIYSIPDNTCQTGNKTVQWTLPQPLVVQTYETSVVNAETGESKTASVEVMCRPDGMKCGSAGECCSNVCAYTFAPNPDNISQPHKKEWQYLCGAGAGNPNGNPNNDNGNPNGEPPGHNDPPGNSGNNGNDGDNGNGGNPPGNGNGNGGSNGNGNGGGPNNPPPPPPTPRPSPSNKPNEECKQSKEIAEGLSDSLDNLENLFIAAHQLNYATSGFSIKAAPNFFQYTDDAPNQLIIALREVEELRDSALEEERISYQEAVQEAAIIINQVSTFAATELAVSMATARLGTVVNSSDEAFLLATRDAKFWKFIDIARSLFKTYENICPTMATASDLRNAKNMMSSFDDKIKGILKAVGKSKGVPSHYYKNVPMSLRGAEDGTINLYKFTQNGRNGELIDPKSGYKLSPDSARNSGVGTHGGSYWKLINKNGERVGTISEDGRYLRK